MRKWKPEEDIVTRMTAAMREADRIFEKTGGSTRYHVQGCLLPILEQYGLRLECIHVAATEADHDHP